MRGVQITEQDRHSVSEAMERVKQRKSAAKEQPIMVEGNGTEEEEISFVAEFKYLVQM